MKSLQQSSCSKNTVRGKLRHAARCLAQLGAGRMATTALNLLVGVLSGRCEPPNKASGGQMRKKKEGCMGCGSLRQDHLVLL